MSDSRTWWVAAAAERWIGPIPATDVDGNLLTDIDYRLALLPRGVEPSGPSDMAWQQPVVDPTGGEAGLGIVADPVDASVKQGLWALIGLDVLPPALVGFVIRE